jgi:RNA-binding protein
METKSPNSDAAKLDNTRKKELRKIGHSLHPVVTVSSKGLTENVLEEINRALNDHELIKIKVIAERDEKTSIIDSICEKTDAALVQTIGHIALVVRESSSPNPKLSNLLRNQ